MKTVEVNEDDYSIIQLTKNELHLKESAAVSVILEVGLINILKYPDVSEDVKKILSEKKYEKWIAQLKRVWNLPGQTPQILKDLHLLGYPKSIHSK